MAARRRMQKRIPSRRRRDISRRSSELEAAEIVKELDVLMQNLLSHELKANGVISTACLADLVHHWERDMDRLSAVQRKGLSPAKYFGYLGFWIRKLKPISNAYPIQATKKKSVQVRMEQEIVDINEKVALYVAFSLLLGFLSSPARRPAKRAGHRKNEEAAAKRFIRNFMRKPSEDKKGTTFDDLVYDMRYRTFGPHHLTHLLNWAMGRM